MEPFVFHSSTKIQYAEGAATAVAELIRDLGGKRVFFITDQVLLQRKVSSGILEACQADAELQTLCFSDVPPDSDVDCVNKAAELAKKSKCDAVIAVGGGSVLDTAKVVNICLSFGGDMAEYQGLNNLPSKLLPNIAIPTTAGTGSEVSPVAMVKDREEGKKLLFGSRFIAPDVAILDPTLLISLPPRLTAATGLDAVTHDIEAYVACATNSAITDALCLESLRMLFEYLPRATKSGDDLEARANTLLASTMAGMAFSNSGVGIVHALAHTVGAKFGTHHGMTNSVFLPYGMSFNLQIASARYANLARYLKLSDSKNDETAAKVLIESMEQFSCDLGLPKNLRDLGVPNLKSQLTTLAELAMTDPAMMFNPKEPTTEDIIGIYEKAY